MAKKIVILGGGYAGVLAGKLLHKKFKKDESVSITLIDKKPFHTLMTELHEVAGGRVEEDSIKVNLEKIFAKRKVDVVLDEVNGIDFKSQKLKSDNNEYDYDYLILGSGSEPCYYGIEGAKEYTKSLWSFENAIKLREHIEDMFRKAAKTKDKEKRKAMLTFVVAGGGFTGVEMAGELGELKNKLCKLNNIDESEVSLYIVDMLPKILPILPDNLIKKSMKRLKKLGIKVMTSTAIKKVTSEAVYIGENGESIPTCTVIWNAGVQGSSFATNLGLTLGKRGRIQANEYMQTVDYKNVYVAGDNAYYEETEGKGIPQIVEIAHQTAETVVHNICVDIKNKGEKETFKSNIHGFMVSIGGRYGVAHLGNMKMSGFFAMLMKHLINMIYLLKIAGFNKVWAYMMHEFFHIKERRSFVGGHFSKSSPNFWLLPMRVFLGIMWLIEGYNKINEGWLSEAKMYASDAVASASQAATASAGVGEPLIKEVPGFMQWIIDNIVAPNAIPFQTFMVCTEIIIGLCLIAGLFTALFSIMSAGMTVAITLTGMADASILWFFFAGIAMIGGSGSAFGLDYYVLPWLKKKWKKFGLVKKSYLYID